MEAEMTSGIPVEDADRYTLARLREKVLARSGRDGRRPDDVEHELAAVRYVLAERELDEAMKKDLEDREKLVEAHLDIGWRAVAVSYETLRSPHILPVLRLVAHQLAEHGEVELAGGNVGSPPRWDRFEIGERVELVPGWATIYWDAGTIADVPLVFETWNKNMMQTIQILSRPADQAVAREYLGRLVRDATGERSPYRGRLLKASWGQQGVDLEILPEPGERREQLVFPPGIWEALDLNVHRMFERMPVLRSAGLGTNRGILLAGAPGTGKTAVCKVLAAEVLGYVTVVFVDSRIAFGLLPQLYKEISSLAPALVLLEDLDLVVGDREDGTAGRPLLDFLTVLDGLMTQHHDVITVATTNDPTAVDAGVRRAARFDRIVQFPVPDAEARRRILDVYLGALEHRVDTSRVAAVTEGKTGADLREYVRSAVLNASDVVETEDLLKIVADDRERTEPPIRRPLRPTRDYL
jgi:ATPase family associated with various cellular activities (AAA)